MKIEDIYISILSLIIVISVRQNLQVVTKVLGAIAK